MLAKKHSPYTDIAINDFRKMEEKRLQLERAEAALHKAIGYVPAEDMDHYFASTEEIRADVSRKAWERYKIVM